MTEGDCTFDTPNFVQLKTVTNLIFNKRPPQPDGLPTGITMSSHGCIANEKKNRKKWTIISEKFVFILTIKTYCANSFATVFDGVVM